MATAGAHRPDSRRDRPTEDGGKWYGGCARLPARVADGTFVPVFDGSFNLPPVYLALARARIANWALAWFSCGESGRCVVDLAGLCSYRKCGLGRCDGGTPVGRRGRAFKGADAASEWRVHIGWWPTGEGHHTTHRRQSAAPTANAYFILVAIFIQLMSSRVVVVGGGFFCVCASRDC